MKGEFSSLRTELWDCSLFHPSRHIQYTANAGLRAIATLAILRPRRIMALGSTPSELVAPSPRVYLSVLSVAAGPGEDSACV